MKNDCIFDHITQQKAATCGARSLRYYVIDGWDFESVQHLYEGDIKAFDLEVSDHKNDHRYSWGYYTPAPSAKLKIKEFLAHINVVKTIEGIIPVKKFLKDVGTYYIEGVIE